MSEVIKAIPTVFNGVQYKSRLEARFAEWLVRHKMEFEYEPHEPCYPSYVPDFYIDGLLLFVEIKPLCFLDEIDIFRDGIMKGPPWICVDHIDRKDWQIIYSNFTYSVGVTFNMPAEFTIDEIGDGGPQFLRIPNKDLFFTPWILASKRLNQSKEDTQP